MWNAKNASHIHTASTAATGLNPNQESTDSLPKFQEKVRKMLDTTSGDQRGHKLAAKATELNTA